MSLPLVLHLSKFNSLSISSTTTTTPFVNGGSAPLSLLKRPSSYSPPSSISFLPKIRAMRSMQGRVVCATNDKTIAVEVTRLAPHPKYKRRVRKKKTYQAHDPDNTFKVGDSVQLEKCRPISKKKTFLAIPLLARKNSKPKETVLDLQSQQQQQQQQA
ncbi:30S ribosomal protein S17, chloroplastic [Impatiens glandulifera]|uniref:30S ribosomal protein S17, chloroplastic n=1 Tax=Impatiens glandulifera TaxID=253017 RepID=UPI001FB05952|nr:30S ribosomal protein S17, chloroplastic [Impatiens glandulifera]